MTQRRPIAFYAPLKSPDHPSPSGDRTMARLLTKALDRAGFHPVLASELRTLDLAGDPVRQERLRERSLAQAAALVESWRPLARERRPALWFTYHVYYKAPDWIGPAVADALGIPYVVAEGSRAAKRATGPWALGHRGAEAALDRADMVLAMTPRDREALEATKPARQLLVDLPPFLDSAAWDVPAPADWQGQARPEGPPRLLAVAMMRAGDKLASYRLLATALERLAPLPWSLDIVGDGEARGEVEALFAGLAPRIRFHGQVEDRARLRALYERADLFVWPAVNEAYGMALLEAQLFGCPVVAGAYGGVASVVKHGVTGLLTPPGDGEAFARAVADLIADGTRRREAGAAALAFVRQERDLDRAAARLGSALRPLIEDAP